MRRKTDNAPAITISVGNFVKSVPIRSTVFPNAMVSMCSVVDQKRKTFFFQLVNVILLDLCRLLANGKVEIAPARTISLGNSVISVRMVSLRTRLVHVSIKFRKSSTSVVYTD